MAQFCDLSLPVPLDQPFTYLLPETLRHRAKPGCRVIAPFGPRKLTGVVIRCHDETPAVECRQVLKLIDEEPVLDELLLALGKWISGYYCAPLGEVLRSMLPLSGEIRGGKTYSLTDAGRQAARQLLLDSGDADPVAAVLRALETRPLSAAWLLKKIPLADKAIRSLERKAFIAAETDATERDPLRAPSANLWAEGLGIRTERKLPKAERELLAYLELYPGVHNLKDLEAVVHNASASARSLARKTLLRLEARAFAPAASLPAIRRELNDSQRRAFEQVRGAIASHQFRTILLEGVTGSGKTEVYLQAIDEVLSSGRDALLLVPEIALTPAVAGQFYSRFGDLAAILHSAFSDRERIEQWRRIRAGAARVVVGTRSGVFAPVRNLGLLIVDEEHDQSYKQEETPRYHARDVAIIRAQAANACVLLGSATPSLESRFNVERGKYELAQMPERIAGRPMPAVELVDMRDEFLETRKQSTFSRRLVDAIAERLASGEQTMILLNRRGFSSHVACRSCGERVECINCSVTLTYHRRDRRMLCHYCNYAAKVPSHCPKCQSEHIYFLGIGSEKVEDELHDAFPTARIARLDRDTASGKRHFEAILSGFREGRFDILVGTQMIAKGHDIPNVTLVGVVSGDVGLGMPDFRAAERTFQLLTQVAGRAGRGSLPGRVLVQTINPDHYAIRLAATQSYPDFYAKELQFRRLMHYPPFSAMANLLVRTEKQADVLRMMAELFSHLSPPPEHIKILGPAEAPVPRLKNEFRQQMLVKSSSRPALKQFLQKARQFALDRKWNATALVIDVDPLTLL